MSDWIEWRGGFCPVPNNTEIEIMLLNGEQYIEHKPQKLIWKHDDHYHNIIAYRIVKPSYEGEASSATIAPSDAAPEQVSAPSPYTTIMRGFAAQHSCALACIMVNEMKGEIL